MSATLAPVAATTFKSRWGYHPCDWNTFLKLKRLHKAYWEHIRKEAAFERWWAKQPQNQHGPEPRYISEFVRYVDCICRSTKEGRQRYIPNRDSHPIRALYLAARKPSPTPVTPFSEYELSEIDRLTTVLEQFEAAAS
jgi:hypothetical protein